jgi:hypothetical protein
MAITKLCRMACLILVVFAQPGLAQRRQSNEPNGAKKSTQAASVSTPAGGLTEKQKSLAISYAYLFRERILNLQDAKTKSLACARLADLLWNHDETFARNLFNAALRFSAPNRASASSKELATASQWSEIVALIERRDPQWAKQIVDSIEPAEKDATLAERSKVRFDNGYALLKSDTAQAVNYIERSLRGGINPFMHSFLISLRLKNETAANTLFLRVLEQVAASPGIDADTLLRLGAYVFTSPKIDPHDPTVPPDTIIVIGVGNLLLPDITADRPNISTQVIWSYLKCAAEILTREAANPTQQAPSFYAAGYMLLPKFEKFAPNQTYLIHAAMQLLAAKVPPPLLQDSAYENLKAPAQTDLEQTLKDVEQDEKNQYRDEKYLSLVSELWFRSEFASARKVSARISDEVARASLDTLINFKEAANLIEHEKAIARVEEIAFRLPHGVERAMLWLGIARVRFTAKRPQRALEAINEALASARKVSDARRPFLLLSAAGQLAAIDADQAKVILLESIRELNAQEAEALTEVQWEQRIECGLLWRYFPLTVKGVEFDFRQTLRPLLKNDMEGTITAALALKDEKQLTKALLAITALMLQPAA